jgi:hypothetical protein
LLRLEVGVLVCVVVERAMALALMRGASLVLAGRLSKGAAVLEPLVLLLIVVLSRPVQ